MEETTTAASLGVFKMCKGFENSAVAARRRRIEIRRLKDIANAGNLSSEPVSKRSRPIIDPSAIVHGDGDLTSPPEPDIDVVTRSFHSFPNSDDQEGEVDCFIPEAETTMFQSPPSSPFLQEDGETLSVDSSVVSYNSEEENVVSMETDLLPESSNLLIARYESVSSTSDKNISCSDLDTTGFEVKQAIISPADIVQEDSIVVSGQESVSSTDHKLVPQIDYAVTDAANHNVSSVPAKSGGSVTSGKVSLVDINRNPPWAYISIAGRRPEMEDAVAAVPRFFSPPCGVIGGSIARDEQKSRESLALHFFGVYDGHGGAQASNFCKERLHHALVEELKTVMNGEGSNINDGDTSWERQWERALVGCFKNVDTEVGQESRRRDDGVVEDHKECCSEPVAPETVGTTAVIAVVCSYQIIVANCGDSRAVLCRAGKAIPLSVDHKPNRDDETARIEAAGGKVIWWNGYRVLGVLAMSRAIGDRYLKPCIIPDPEVTFTQRAKEDECLILASDGLWDVVSNNEACDLARRCIARWHNNNTNYSSNPMSETMDPAAQAAANHLCKLAIQRGSSDNITVLVVDLKAKRRRTPKN